MPAPTRPLPYTTQQNALNVPKGIVGYYTDIEIDALLAGLAGGGLQTVDLSAYATTAYVDGQVATLYSKAEVDAAIKAAAEQAALDLDAVQNQLLFAIEETGKQTQAKIDLKADQVTTYTKTEVDEAIANAAAGGTVDLNGYAKTEDLPAVYEQDDEPATGKNGDLWLSITAATAAEISALVAKADTKDLDDHVARLVRSLMAGGKTVPPDIDWSACTKILGSGLVEARVLNGMIQLRGELTYTMTSVGSFATVQRLPANFPKPPVEQTVVVFGFESGVAYRRVFVRFQPDGGIAICGDAKITGTSFNGAQAFSY